jgi:hypothetical protein
MRCTGCGKSHWRPAKECPSCGELLREHQLARQLFATEYLRVKREIGQDEADAMGVPPQYTPGCSACFMGLVLTRQSQCCCFENAVVKCIDCVRVGDPYQPHVCLVESPEESDQALLHAFMPKVRTRPPSKEGKSRAAALDQSQGIRVKKYD